MGGCETHFGAVFVNGTNQASARYGDATLQPGDRILAINKHGLLTATKTEVIQLLSDIASTSARFVVMHLGTEQWKKIQAESHKEDHSTYNKKKLRRIRALRLRRSKASGGVETSGSVHVAHLRRAKGSPLGFTIAGGSDTKLGAVFVTQIDAKAFVGHPGDLCVGDRVLEVSGVPLTSATQHDAFETLKKQGTEMDIVVQRLGASKWAAITASLKIHSKTSQRPASSIPKNSFAIAKRRAELEEKFGTKGLGFLLSGHGSDPNKVLDQGSSTASFNTTKRGVRVTKIVDGGVAALDGRLRQLDRLLTVNGVDVSEMSLAEVSNHLRLCQKEVTMVVGRGKQNLVIRLMRGQSSDSPPPVSKPLSGDKRNSSLDFLLDKGRWQPRQVVSFRVDGEFPFELIGRSSQGMRLDSPRISGTFIESLKSLGPSAGSLPRVGDMIVKVNGIDVTAWSARNVRDSISRARDRVSNCSCSCSVLSIWFSI